MGAVLPLIFINLVLYILIAVKLKNRANKSTNTRDNTLSRAFLLLSVSWMILWSPLIVFRILFGFLEVPDLLELFELWGSDYKSHERYYLAEFAVTQISVLFSTVNSVILIVVLRPFHDPLMKIAMRVRKCRRGNVEWSSSIIESLQICLGLLRDYNSTIKHWSIDPPSLAGINFTSKAHVFFTYIFPVLCSL